MTTRVTVRLFARFRELAGQDAIDLLMPPNANVAEIRRELNRLWPDVSALLAVSAIAVNDDYAADDYLIAANDDVALIPPVSGGGGRTPLLPLDSRQKRSSAATERATT